MLIDDVPIESVCRSADGVTNFLTSIPPAHVGLLMQQVDAAGLENGSISGPIVDLQVRSFTESDCETVIFQLELPMYTAEDVSSNVSLRPSVEQAIEDLVVATLPNMELHLIATRISRNEDNNRGVAVFDTSIDFYDTAEGGRFAAYLTVDGGHEAVFLDHGLGTAHLRQQECRFTKNGEQAVQQHLDIVSFTGRPFEGHGHFETFESIEALYRIALVRLLESLDNSRQLPHIDLQSFPGPDELINIQARIAFREDQEGARKFESLIGLWGLAINGRAQALGPEDALRSESALSAAVKDVSRTIHISNRVRFTLTLRECEMPLVSAEGLHKLEMALKDFYADVLPQIIGMPSAVNILWSRVHEQITSTVTLGLSIQFLDNSGAAEKLTALLTAKSTYFNNMSPPQLGIADYTDVTGRHDTSTLRFTGHLPGQDLGGMGPEHLEHLRLEYATAIKSLSSALSLQDSDPSVRVLQIQDSCVRRKEVQCGMELMLDTIMTLADDVDGAQRFQEAISHPSPRGFDRSPLTRLLRNATFTNIAGCDNLRPPTNAQHADDITRGVWFSTILLDQNSPSSSLELKYGAWGQGFVDK